MRWISPVDVIGVTRDQVAGSSCEGVGRGMGLFVASAVRSQTGNGGLQALPGNPVAAVVPDSRGYSTGSYGQVALKKQRGLKKRRKRKRNE